MTRKIVVTVTDDGEVTIGRIPPDLNPDMTIAIMQMGLEVVRRKTYAMETLNEAERRSANERRIIERG